MVTHSSTLAWKISWTEEPGRLQSMVSQRVGHDWIHCTPALILIFLTVSKIIRLTANIFAFVLVWGPSMIFFFFYIFLWCSDTYWPKSYFQSVVPVFHHCSWLFGLEIQTQPSILKCPSEATIWTLHISKWSWWGRSYIW